MRQGGEPQGVQVVRQGEPTPYHCDFNPLYIGHISLELCANPKFCKGFKPFQAAGTRLQTGHCGFLRMANCCHVPLRAL